MLKYICFLFLSVFAFGQTDSVQNHLYKLRSSIAVPIVIPMSEINRLVNESISGTVYEDNSFTDNNNDQFKTKVEKDGAITIIGLSGTRIMISVPLKVWAEQGFGAFGHYAYQSTSFKVKMNYISDVRLKNNWHLETKTKATDFEWTQKPVLSLKGVNIPISPLISGRLKKKQEDFTKIIDSKVAQQLNLSPYVLMAVNQLRNPMEISPEYQTWLRITPLSFSATPLKVASNQISGTLGVELYSETFVGQKPSQGAYLLLLPNFISKNNIDDTFLLQTTVNVPYAGATELARKQFLGKELSFRDDKSKVTIEDIKLYPDKDQVTIEAKVKGSVNGSVLITGTPIYNGLKNEIVLANTHLKIRTANVLIKTYSLLFQGRIKRMIEQEYGIPLKDIVGSARSSLQQSLNSEIYNGLTLQGTVLDFEPKYMVPEASGIAVVVDTRARLKLLISGLSF